MDNTTTLQLIVDLNEPAASIPPDVPWDSRPYPLAIAFATLSLCVVLLITPPMFWHFRNRNFGATVLVALAIYANLQNFVNAVIWRNDDIPNWYDGVGLCDIEINVQLAAQVAFPASLVCILRALAQVLDTDNAVLMKTEAQQRRALAIDIVCCFVIPLIEVPLHYIVPGVRYYILGITGCVPGPDASWLTTVLLIVPAFLWTLADVYYSILVLVRLIRYRRTIDSVLAHSNTSKSRFFRLYLLCIVCVLGWFPTEIYILYVNAVSSTNAYSWSEAHDPALFRTAIFVPSNGHLFYDRYIWLAGGLVVFFFFGFGKDAVAMYRAGLLRLGFGRVFPRLKQSDQRGPSGSSTSPSKIKLLFSKGHDTISSLWSSRSTRSKAASVLMSDGEYSPNFSVPTREKLSPLSDTDEQESRKPSFLARLNPRFESDKNISSTENTAKPFGTDNYRSTHSRISSTAIAEPSSVFNHPPGAVSNERVMVVKEIQQTNGPKETALSKEY